jgi:osmotically-inducible protein OsmY
MSKQILTVSLALALSGAAAAQNQDKPVAPDNSKVNKNDRATNAPTADQQKENRSDRDLTAEIRKAITADKTLSTYAHNVKIITQHGIVTLKGPVHTEQEKASIEAKAAQIAGAGTRIENQITVKGDK